MLDHKATDEAEVRLVPCIKRLVLEPRDSIMDHVDDRFVHTAGGLLFWSALARIPSRSKERQGGRMWVRENASISGCTRCPFWPCIVMAAKTAC